MITCPFCGHDVPDEARQCPHCGPSTAPVWPPPAAAPPVLPPVRYLTGRRGGDIALGIIAGVVSPVAWGFASFLLHSIFFYLNRFLPLGLIGRYGLFFVATLGLYLWARPRYPVFARSFGWTFLAEVVLALGALALCIVVVSHSG